jgi:hypothetical protein
MQQNANLDGVLKQQAKIYGRQGKPLTNYQKAVNVAAVEIAKQDPVIVLDKGVNNSKIHMTTYVMLYIKASQGMYL